VSRPTFRVRTAVLPSALLALWLVGERGRLLRRSTWKAIREGGVRKVFSLKGIHSYVYGRWTNQYVATLVNRVYPRLGDRGFEWWRHRYHAKVLTTEHAEAIVMLDHDLPQRDLEQIIPYRMARQLVLSGPPDVAAYECACRHARQTHCEPTQVCMAIGQPVVDFILEHNPRSSRRLTQAEAVELLRAERDRGHVHSAWFKDAADDRFYAICNCCKCCCGGIEAMVTYGSPIMASSGYVARVDAEACTSCAACVEACPFGALSMDGVAAVNWEKCMGCGVCTSQCESGGVSLVRDEAKGIPLDVRALA
jgi:Fe-S-cluster-containing hydrogenase component 2